MLVGVRLYEKSAMYLKAASFGNRKGGLRQTEFLNIVGWIVISLVRHDSEKPPNTSRPY